MFCGNDGIRNLVEFLAGSIFEGAADFFNIHIEYFGEYVGIAHTVACYFDTLYGGKTVAYHLLKSVLKFRITVKTEFGSKTDYGGFGNTDGFAELCGGHKSGFVIVGKDEVSDALLSF